jgi:glycine/D-amino acid oxidase-like deaminating enzyme
MSDHQDLAHALWSGTSAEPPVDCPPLEGDRHADVAIVGGGYTGLSTALHLKEMGADAVVLEAREPGWGASGRNVGQVIAGLKYEPVTLERMYGAEIGGHMWRVGGGGPDMLYDLIRRFDIRCELVNAGWIQPAVGERGLRTVAMRAEQWAERGVDCGLLSRDKVAEMTGVTGYDGGWIDRRGGSLQPLALVRGMARACLGLGVAIHGNSPVASLTRDGASWRVATAGGTVVAESVVLATNAYDTGLWPGLGRSIVPVRPVLIASRPLSPNLRGSILPGGEVESDTKRLLTYFRFDAQGHLIMGGRGALGHAPSPRLYDQLRVDAGKRFPQIEADAWQHAWTGWIAMTADHLPHLHNPAPGLWAALGYQGRGVALATAMGRELALRMRGGEAGREAWPVTDLRPLPFHGLRRPVLSAMRTAWRFLDRLETRSAPAS